MKRFLTYGILFLLPLLVASALLEYGIRQIPNPYRYKYEWMEQNAETVEVLVFGSSHAFYGIRPEFFDRKAFNLANVSQTREMDAFLLTYWAGRYRNLETIICPVSYASWFLPELESGSEAYRCRYYRIYMDCDLYPDRWPYNLELSDLRTARGKIIRHFSSKDSPGYDGYGWGNTYTLSRKDGDRWQDGSEAAAAVKRHTAREWDQVERNYELLREMARFCRRHQIRMVLVTIPCWPAYYENLDEGQLEKMDELTQRIRQEFGLSYRNYLKDPRFGADDFYDSNHLSDVGAAKFTKILYEDLRP